MLVLSRKINETIIIGDGMDKVEVTVIEIRGDKVRLGVKAPREVPVHRLEVASRIEREKLDQESSSEEQSSSSQSSTKGV